MRGVFLDRSSMDRDDLDFTVLESLPVDWNLYDTTEPHQVLSRVQSAEIVITNKVVLDSRILESAPSLRYIGVAATGTNNIDLDAARLRQICVSNVTAYATPSVVQHVFMYMLVLATRVLDYRLLLARGEWQRAQHFCLLDFPVTELAGKTLGIIGYGELGHAVAQMARALGMEVQVAQSLTGKTKKGRVPVSTLLQTSDVISLHCPLTAQTRGLIGAEELASMKSHAILINTARGGIVDESALLSALKDGSIGGAGIDVLFEEPPVNGNALLDVSLPNLIVTPHTAWASREARQRLLDGLVGNIRAFISGNPQNRVD